MIVESTAEDMTQGENGAQPETEPRKRGRGRPRKDGTESPQSPDKDKPRPRKVKSAKGKRIIDEVARANLARSLVGLHQIAAMATGIPEIQLDDRSAAMLAVAIADVQEEFDFDVDGKVTAILTLLGVSALIYVPRVMAIKKRVNENQPIDVPQQEAA